MRWIHIAITLSGFLSFARSVQAFPNGDLCYGQIEPIDLKRRILTFVYRLDRKRYRLRVTDDTRVEVFVNRQALPRGGGHYTSMSPGDLGTSARGCVFRVNATA
jgi:hypothetical protein